MWHVCGLFHVKQNMNILAPRALFSRFSIFTFVEKLLFGSGGTPHRPAWDWPAPPFAKRKPVQNGRTITKITIRIVAIAGASLAMRSVFSDTGRRPRAIFLPRPVIQMW